MKIELHLHTSLYSPCAANTPDEMVRALVETGYDAVYITEHDAVWRDSELWALQRKFPRIRIFPGVELSLGDQHLLVLGTNDPDYLRILDPAEVLEKARGEGHMTVLAHPFRWRGGAEMLWEYLRPDAIEYRTCNQDAMMGGVALDTARNLRLRVVNAGDVHALSFINRFYIQTQRDVEQADEIRRIVLDGAYSLWPVEEGRAM